MSVEIKERDIFYANKPPIIDAIWNFIEVCRFYHDAKQAIETLNYINQQTHFPNYSSPPLSFDSNLCDIQSWYNAEAEKLDTLVKAHIETKPGEELYKFGRQGSMVITDELVGLRFSEKSQEILLVFKHSKFALKYLQTP